MLTSRTNCIAQFKGMSSIQRWGVGQHRPHIQAAKLYITFIQILKHMKSTNHELSVWIKGYPALKKIILVRFMLSEE